MYRMSFAQAVNVLSGLGYEVVKRPEAKRGYLVKNAGNHHTYKVCQDGYQLVRLAKNIPAACLEDRSQLFHYIREFEKAEEPKQMTIEEVIQ